MTDVLVRSFPADLAVRDDGDGRTLHGPLLPYGVEARVMDRGRLVVETFQRGALAGTDPARIPLTATHPRDNQTLPIGVTVELEERADAAWGAWRVSKTTLGDEVLELAREQRLTTWPWSECPPTRVPGWSACEGPHRRAPPRHCSH
jgi:uncharacterized protein